MEAPTQDNEVMPDLAQNYEDFQAEISPDYDQD